MPCGCIYDMHWPKQRSTYACWVGGDREGCSQTSICISWFEWGRVWGNGSGQCGVLFPEQCYNINKS